LRRAVGYEGDLAETGLYGSARVEEVRDEGAATHVGRIGVPGPDADRHVLAAERGSLKNKGKLANGVHALPKDVDREIASPKLKAMGIAIDELSEEQARYLVSWEEGT
jgi:hypothetical protein